MVFLFVLGFLGKKSVVLINVWNVCLHMTIYDIKPNWKEMKCGDDIQRKLDKKCSEVKTQEKIPDYTVSQGAYFIGALDCKCQHLVAYINY